MKVLGINCSPRKGGNTEILINEMIIPGLSYWNMAIGREKGEVLKDEEGMKTMTVLGKNMAWLLKKTGGKRDKS